MEPNLLDALLASLHHLLVFALVAVLFAELLQAEGVLDGDRLRRLVLLDQGYGALAGSVVVAGFLRAVFGAKGWSYYATNPVFWTKIALFAAVGLMSAVPTVRLIRWRKQSALPDAGAVYDLRQWMLAQLAVLALIPMLAALMARGFGA
jgi:putative membrane protein